MQAFDEQGGTTHTLRRRLFFMFRMSSNRHPDMLSLDAYLLQEVEVQKMDEELGKEVLTLLALLVQKYEY